MLYQNMLPLDVHVRRVYWTEIDRMDIDLYHDKYDLYHDSIFYKNTNK